MNLKRIPRLLVVLAALACCPALAGCATGAGSGPVTLRVMSYNIHHGEGTDGVFDYERLAKVIRDRQPDLVALQEVDRGTTRASGADQAEALAKRTNMHHAYAAAMAYAGGEYGEAILSRWPIDSIENFVVDKRQGSEPRALLITRIALPGGNELAFAGTHLAHDSDRDRIEQAWRMRMKLDEAPYESMPVILAGDLNARPGSGPMRELLVRGGFADVFAGDPRPTFPSVNPDRRIDWILIKPRGWTCRVIETEVVENEIASDHCPIIATIQIAPP